MICPNCRNNVNQVNGRCPNCSFPLPGLDTSNNIQSNLEVNNSISDLSNMNALEEFNRNFSLDELSNLNNDLKEEQNIKETKQDKPKKKNPILLIILLLIILTLGGYIIYNKLFNNDKKVIIKTNTVKEYKLTKQEALGLGNYLWNYAFDTVWCRNFAYSEEPNLISEGLNGFEITNYDDIIKNFTSDFTYEYNGNNLTFNDIFGKYTLDNKYYDTNKCVRDANPSYKTTSLSIKLIDYKEINYKATSIYCEGENCIDNNIEKEFTIVKENKSWKIKKFYLPN